LWTYLATPAHGCPGLAAHIPHSAVKLFKTTLTGPAQDTFINTLKQEKKEADEERNNLDKLGPAVLMFRALNELAQRCFMDGEEEAPKLQSQYMLHKLLVPAIEH
jgi:hypothetical protein